MRACLYALAAISCQRPATVAIRNETGPVTTTAQVWREVLIDRDRNSSFRETFELETTGDRARLTITRERNVVARLDAWPEPWTTTSTTTFLGTITRSATGTDYVFQNGTTMIELSCGPRTASVLPATARLAASAGDCNDPRGHWEPATTERVEAISCTRMESGRDAPPLYFTAAPGIEWVDERNGCVAYGQGFRWMTN